MTSGANGVSEKSRALLARIDGAIAEKSLLKHPFYQDWQAGKLSRAALQLYATQYYRHVEAFPKHLRVLAARADGDGPTQLGESNCDRTADAGRGAGDDGNPNGRVR